MKFMLADLLDNERLGITSENRMRLATHISVAFYLSTTGDRITTAELAKRTGLNPRTINIGFKHFVERRYMTSEPVKASHGRGRAYEYTFTDTLVAKIIAIAEVQR
jgi:hypothetical protein